MRFELGAINVEEIAVPQEQDHEIAETLDDTPPRSPEEVAESERSFEVEHLKEAVVIRRKSDIEQ